MKFLGTYSLRSGAVTAAVLYYVIAFMILLPSFWLVFVLGNGYEVVPDDDYQTFVIKPIDGDLSPGAVTARTFGLMMIPLGAIFLFCAVVLHIGILHSNPMWVQVWLAFTVGLFGYSMLYDVFKLITTLQINFFNLFVDILVGYLWIVVFGYYKELKTAEEER